MVTNFAATITTSHQFLTFYIQIKDSEMTKDKFAKAIGEIIERNNFECNDVLSINITKQYEI